MLLVSASGVIADPWVAIGDMDAVPACGDVMLAVRHWLGERAQLRARAGRTGLVVEADDPLEAVIADLSAIDLVALNFTNALDGRHYSHAVLLRQRYGFTGEIRATGDIRRDQVYYLFRCGIDTFALPQDTDVAAFLTALRDFSVVYQHAPDARTPAYRLRNAYN